MVEREGHASVFRRPENVEDWLEDFGMGDSPGKESAGRTAGETGSPLRRRSNGKDLRAVSSQAFSPEGYRTHPRCTDNKSD